MTIKTVQIILLVGFIGGAIEAQPLNLPRIARDLTNTDYGYVIAPVGELRQFEGARALVEQPAIMINIGYPGGASEDLVLAETQIFRPLFTYRQQKTKKLRLKKVIDQTK